MAEYLLKRRQDMFSKQGHCKNDIILNLIFEFFSDQKWFQQSSNTAQGGSQVGAKN